MRFFSFWRRQQREQELNDEINAHLQMALQDRLERGQSLQEAKAAVRKEFGNVGLVKEITRGITGSAFWESIGKDLCYACRVLAKNPGFSLISIVALALGIGANSAVYGAVHSVLLSPLPFPSSERLMRLWESFGTPGNYAPVSYPNFRDWRAWNHSFTDMAAYSGAFYTLTGWGEASHVEGVVCSASFFRVLQAQPILGRTFLPEEDRPGANHGVNSVILSHRFWQERFGQSTSILGHTIFLNRKSFAVVGVMPRGFNDYTGVDHSDFWVTTAVLAERSPGAPKPVSEERGISFLNVVARLKPGISTKQAQADMDRVAATLMRTYPKEAFKEGVIVRSFKETITGDVRPLLLLLFGAAGTVLAITCANIAGLMAARMTRRQRELNVRAAVGAGQWRMIRQLFTESLLLCLAGLGVGLWLATLTSRYIRLSLHLPDPVGPALNLSVFGFGAFSAIVATAILSISPAVQVFKADLIRGLKEAALNMSESGRQRRIQQGLAVTQIAFAIVLLSTASLFTLGLIRLQQVDLGFAPEHTLSFPISLVEPQYVQSQRPSVFRELEDRLRRLPGVQFVGAGSQLPLQSNISNTVLDKVGGRAIPMREWTGITYAAVSGDYFQALGIQLRAGRVFTSGDTALSSPVVVINQTAARKYFGSKSPVGELIEPVMWNGAGSTTKPRTIVGVVGDVKLQGIGDEARPMVYWPLQQIPSSDTLFIAVRAKGDPRALLSAIRNQVQAIDKDLPLYNVQPLTEVVQGSLATPMHITTIVTSFGLLALLLTAIGIFGVIAFDVAQRTREIGIRMALGAQRTDVVEELLKQAGVISATGFAIGFPAAMGVAHLLQGSFFGVPLQEPMSLALTAFLLLGAIFLASFLPGLRAARIDPIKALHYE